MFARRTAAALCALLLALAGGAGATIVAPNYVISEIPTPDVAGGGIAVVGTTVFVGVGAFGANTMSVVRIDAGGATTLADGFNALSGMAYDPVNDRLIVGDNGFEQIGAETGDTVFAIPNPFDPVVTPLRAKDIEILPAGSLPAAADVILDPTDATGNRLFVSDAGSGVFPNPPNGGVYAVDAALATQVLLQTGLGFAGGLAASGSELFIGELDATTFQGVISVASLPDGSGALTTVVDDLIGLTDLLLASDGNLLSTSSTFFPTPASKILRIDPVTGQVIEEVAEGFGFASAIDEQEGVIYALDGVGVFDRIFVFTPVPEPATGLCLAAGLSLLAGRGRARRRAREA